MPPKTIKSGQHSKLSVQMEEENLPLASKKLAEAQSEFNAATKDDILSAIHSLKADITIHQYARCYKWHKIRFTVPIAKNGRGRRENLKN